MQKIKLALEIIKCQVECSDLDRNCHGCPVEDACDELFCIIKRKFLPSKNGVEIGKLLEIIEKREKQ